MQLSDAAFDFLFFCFVRFGELSLVSYIYFFEKKKRLSKTKYVISV